LSVAVDVAAAEVEESLEAEALDPVGDEEEVPVALGVADAEFDWEALVAVAVIVTP
jgi:hypothetical protein